MPPDDLVLREVVGLTPRIEQEIKQKVEGAVLALLPPPAPQWNTGSQVDVTSYDDARPTANRELSRWMEASTWITEHWQVVAVGLAILFGVLLYCGWKGQTLPEYTRASNNASSLVPEHTGEGTQPKPSETGESATAADPRGELSRRIKENPDAAAKVLKQWLNKAA